MSAQKTLSLISLLLLLAMLFTACGTQNTDTASGQDLTEPPSNTDTNPQESEDGSTLPYYTGGGSGSGYETPERH